MARRDIAFDAEGVTLRGWFYADEQARPNRPYRDHGARLLRGEGDVPGQLRRGLRGGRAECPRLRQPAASGPATASPGRRSTRGLRCATTGTPSPTPAPCPRWTRAHRDLGQQLLRRPRPGRRGDRPPGQGRGQPGAADQRARQPARAGPVRLHRRVPRDVRRRPPGPLPRRTARDGPRRGQGPAGAVRAADAGFVGVVLRDRQHPRPGLAQRGHAAERWRCSPNTSPRTYLPYISPTPLLLLVAEGDHLVPAELAIAGFDLAHQPKELVILPGGHFDAYVKGFEGASSHARDWFTRHLAS